ncbi:hypothetical protein [Lysobacter enzymogenes]|uniref:hypothetical protein n=1 Tax=Lysobacter enzymogenes TaxID=69 RepID=UPI000F4BE6CA|nr:hypothetical protein [Lysobacter enzymogenes]
MRHAAAAPDIAAVESGRTPRRLRRFIAGFAATGESRRGGCDARRARTGRSAHAAFIRAHA